MRFNRIFLFLLIFLLIASPLSSCKKANAATTEANAAPKTDFIDELTFLGDSTTAHMQLRASVDKSKVWAAKNRNMTGTDIMKQSENISPMQ